MKEVILQAEKREQSTKGALKAMRRQGRVPGVAYGDKDGPMAITLDEKSLQAALKAEGGRNALITLKIGEASHPALMKEIQRNAITRAILHVDFRRISLKQKVEVSVPLHVKGEAPGVKLSGGVLEHLVRAVSVRCLPTEIPTGLDVDVSTLQIGQSIKAKELTIPPAVEMLLDPESVIVNIVAPTVLEEPTAAAAAAPTTTEPEVIKKGKVEEGEAAAPTGKPAEAAAEKKAAAPAAAKPEAKKPEGK
jgi:large subunit ribosomal protein L25